MKFKASDVRLAVKVRTCHSLSVVLNKKETMRISEIVVLIFCLLLLGSCGETRKPEGAVIIWDKHENGNHKTVHQFLTDPGDFSDDYFYQEFFENGNLKIQGLENRRVRKGEWKIYFETGELKAILTFDNGSLEGPATIYNKSGTIIATDTAENGLFRNESIELNAVIRKNIDFSDNRTNWDDSLKQAIDSLEKIIKN